MNEEWNELLRGKGYRRMAKRAGLAFLVLIISFGISYGIAYAWNPTAQFYDKEQVEAGDSIAYQLNGSPYPYVVKVQYCSDNLVIYSFMGITNQTAAFSGQDYPYFFIHPGLGAGSVFDYTEMLRINSTFLTTAWTNQDRWENFFYGLYYIPVFNQTWRVIVYWDAVTGVMLYESLNLQGQASAHYEYILKSQDVWGLRSIQPDWFAILMWVIVLLTLFLAVIDFVVRKEDKKKRR